MPQPRKVDLLPEELRAWLQEELRARGFGGYEELAEGLNARLAAQGCELRIGKSALHAYGQEFRDYARLQEQAQDEIRAFLAEASLADEVKVTSALFQQLTTIAWRLQMAMASPDQLPDPKGLKDLTTALNNLIRSSDLREKIVAEERRAQAQRLDGAVRGGRDRRGGRRQGAPDHGVRMTTTMLLGLALYALATVADVATTSRALARGGREGNPVIRFAMERLGAGWVVAKGALALLVGALLVASGHAWPLFLAAVVTAAVAWLNTTRGTVMGIPPPDRQRPAGPRGARRTHGPGRAARQPDAGRALRSTRR